MAVDATAWEQCSAVRVVPTVRPRKLAKVPFVELADGQLQGDLMPTQEFIDKSWKQQGDKTDYPRYLFQNSQANTTRNSIYYEKGDFLCLREVTLSYAFPSTMLHRLKVGSLRVYATGNNLHYFTKYKGPVPEDGGSDNGRYPIPRNFTLGANISL